MSTFSLFLKLRNLISVMLNHSIFLNIYRFFSSTKSCCFNKAITVREDQRSSERMALDFWESFCLIFSTSNSYLDNGKFQTSSRCSMNKCFQKMYSLITVTDKVYQKELNAFRSLLCMIGQILPRCSFLNEIICIQPHIL